MFSAPWHLILGRILAATKKGEEKVSIFLLLPPHGKPTACSQRVGGGREGCSRVVAITSNEMQGGMYDGRLFRAGFTKHVVFSIVLLLQASCQTRMSRGCCA